MTFTDDEVRIGVVLVTISGVAWRITTADGSACFGMEGTEFDHCGRQQCLRNNSMSHGLLYPEFQHRQPPPTYQASMQEYRLRLLLLDRDRSHGRRIVNAVSNPQSSSSPPPTYRSNTGSQLRSTSDRSGKDCCGQWFNGPPLRFLVALVALGRVACTLGGATLGSIALAGSPTSHLTAGLLMTDNEKCCRLQLEVFYNLIKFGAYLNGAFLQIFLLSFFCEKLRTSSENIAKKIANSNWYMCKDIGMKKNYQMVLLKAQQPVELTALNFLESTLKFFTHMETWFNYEDLSPKPDATPDDSIARNFNENSTQIETTTRSENEVRKRRNLADSMFTTRKEFID
ncbi:hypothetical protein PVAND_000894 [Polypedilum vanderplanki]|uniref:Uncharacterized protein n=1 Tax=Polypedilum vanderplanki TaxID=319348 RepID=A0A9J6BML5_POLVA|nr:hypothetical protein PVAND_000894 [Polypedilum vanderplanki]